MPGQIQGQVSEHDEAHGVALGHCRSDLVGLAFGLFTGLFLFTDLFLFTGVAQRDGRAEADLAAKMFDGLNADRRCDVRFFSMPGPPDQDDVLGSQGEGATWVNSQ